ncbi:hypothetical protein HUU53_01035 [Candidatus Micrarchaeota archaeon]|nr:hypothetical protein [Candidatus Micrarchaeota archaeon]
MKGFYSVALALLFSLLYLLASTTQKTSLIDYSIQYQYSGIEDNLRDLYASKGLVVSYNSGRVVFRDALPASSFDNVASYVEFENSFFKNVELSKQVIEPEFYFGKGIYKHSGGDVVFDSTALSEVDLRVYPVEEMNLVSEQITPALGENALLLKLLVNSSTPLVFESLVDKSFDNTFVFNSTSGLLVVSCGVECRYSTKVSAVVESSFDASPVELINVLSVFSIVANRTGSVRISR